MKNDLRHRGLGLAELLGALVIFGLALSLGGLLVASFINASNRIFINEQATSTGNRLVGQLESAMADSGGDQYSACPGNQDCLILENNYEYIWDAGLGEVVLSVHDPALETEVALDNGQILINGSAVDLGGFTLDPLSAMTIQLSGTEVTVTVQFALIAADGRVFSFTASHHFSLSDIPAA